MKYVGLNSKSTRFFLHATSQEGLACETTSNPSVLPLQTSILVPAARSKGATPILRAT